MVSTLLDLMHDPDTSPNTIEILEPDLAQATNAAKALEALPGSRTRTHARALIPKDQEEKLALIDDASFFFQNTMSPDMVKPAPTPAETLAVIETTAGELSQRGGGGDSPAAAQARRLAEALTGSPRPRRRRGRRSSACW